MYMKVRRIIFRYIYICINFVYKVEIYVCTHIFNIYYISNIYIKNIYIFERKTLLFTRDEIHTSCHS